MANALEGVDAAWLRCFRRSLLNWYARHGRDLPWRESSDPYRVWISEIMLQQTTVTAVKPYFERFLKRFPNVAKLAAASEHDVLRLWEGLGYYSRARNLHKAARFIVKEHGGTFPQFPDELRQLPGIGRYTAGAIASFAFDRPAPILEANTLRLYCRLLGFRGDPRSAAGQRLLWDFAEALVPAKQPGHFNQALMDLGATICTPTEPQCNSCPVVSCCRAQAEGAQDEIPQPARRPEVTDVSEASVAIEYDSRYLLMRRPEGVRWAGLWDLPRYPIDGVARSQQPAHLERRIAEDFGLEVQISERLTRLKHSVTRYRITLDCWHAECVGSNQVTSKLTAEWILPREFARFPLSVTGRKLADLIVRELDEPNLFRSARRS